MQAQNVKTATPIQQNSTILLTINDRLTDHHWALLTFLNSGAPNPEGLESWLHTSKPTVLLIEPTNLFWAPQFICIFKLLNISFLICTLCRDLHLESCILCISAENLVIPSLWSRELLWIGFCTGALLYTIFNPVLTQTPSLRLSETFHPLLTRTFILHRTGQCGEEAQIKLVPKLRWLWTLPTLWWSQSEIYGWLP